MKLRKLYFDFKQFEASCILYKFYAHEIHEDVVPFSNNKYMSLEFLKQ